MKRLLVTMLLLCSAPLLWAQQVTDVNFSIVDDTLTITYTLTQQADICVRVAIDDGPYTEPLKGFTGAVGEKVKPGMGLQMQAVRLPEIAGVDSASLHFLVEVDDGALLVYVDNFSFRMMPVEGGSFTMGCTHPRGEKHTYADELPLHKVTVNSFYIGRFEVTQGLWKKVMGENPSKWFGNDSLPVEQVSWNDVQIFIARLSQITGYRFRLPTEAEWEYAARGGKKSKGYLYAGSNNIDEVAYTLSNRKAHEQLPVASLKPNELGIYDMSGNVWEWCEDWYRKTPASKPSSNFIVIRGGGHDCSPRYCRSTNRFMYDQRRRRDLVGFRLALSVR